MRYSWHTRLSLGINITVVLVGSLFFYSIVCYFLVYLTYFHQLSLYICVNVVVIKGKEMDKKISPH